MIKSIQEYWDSTDIDYLVKMTESDILELLDSIASKYSNRYITIMILDDHTSFERMDERGLN